MSTLEAILLGIIQGLTEFFPISSSGHLKLFQSLLGFTHLDHLIIFDLICHLGTLLAIFCVFYKQIKQVIVSNHTLFWQIALAIVPLFPLLLVMKPIKTLFAEPQYLGFFFLFTALLLFIGVKGKWQAPPEYRQRYRWRDALTIGVFQAIAILPGVSRSGATISIGRRLGWSYEEAASFSFLLAIPTICGGALLELLQLLRMPPQATTVEWPQYLLAFAASFIVGFAALKGLMKMAVKGNFIYFVWYCIAIGIFSLIYFHW